MVVIDPIAYLTYIIKDCLANILNDVFVNQTMKYRDYSSYDGLICKQIHRNIKNYNEKKT